MATHHLTGQRAIDVWEAHFISAYRAQFMTEKKHDAERLKAPFDQEQREEESHQPGWIQKYLDLADLLMKRRRRKKDDDRKAA